MLRSQSLALHVLRPVCRAQTGGMIRAFAMPYAVSRQLLSPSSIASKSRPFSTTYSLLQNKLKQPIEKAKEKVENAREKTKDILNSIKDQTNHEKVMTLPNVLTFSRLFASPLIGYLVVNHHTSWALGLFAYSCVTDLLDGWIARRFNMQSVVGSVIDPMADKALMMTLAGCLAASGDIPIYMAVLILGRDFLLGLSALYYRYISLPPPKTFARFWDFSLPSAEVHPTTISKYNTFLQMIYLGCALTYPAILPTLEPSTAESIALGLQGLEYVTATTTVLSGLSYVFSKSAVKILHKNN